MTTDHIIGCVTVRLPAKREANTNQNRNAKAADRAKCSPTALGSDFPIGQRQRPRLVGCRRLFFLLREGDNTRCRVMILYALRGVHVAPPSTRLSSQRAQPVRWSVSESRTGEHLVLARVGRNSSNPKRLRNYGLPQ